MGSSGGEARGVCCRLRHDGRYQVAELLYCRREVARLLCVFTIVFGKVRETFLMIH